MEILGIGGLEIAAILIIMLVVAGPKRMAQWSYTLGKYIAVLRDMWSQAADQFQRELNDAGVDVEVPKTLPTRASLNRDITRAVSKVAAPVRDPLNALKEDLKADVGSVREAADSIRPTVPAKAVPSNPVIAAMAKNAAAKRDAAAATNGNGAARPEDAPPPAAPSAFGTWSGE